MHPPPELAALSNHPRARWQELPLHRHRRRKLPRPPELTIPIRELGSLGKKLADRWVLARGSLVVSISSGGLKRAWTAAWVPRGGCCLRCAAPHCARVSMKLTSRRKLHAVGDCILPVAVVLGSGGRRRGSCDACHTVHANGCRAGKTGMAWMGIRLRF